MPLMFKTSGFLAMAALLLGALAACSPLGVLNAVSPDSGAEVTTRIAYGEGPRRQLDVYAPPQAEAAPVMLFLYGGTWNRGSRSDYAFVGHALASRGMVAVLADYRLYPEVTYPEFLRDSAGAAAWTVGEIARFGGDPERVFVMGHSAGAYNAAMVALDPRWLAEFDLGPDAFRGWIGLAGPYDFIPIINPDVKPIFHHPDTPPDSQPIVHVSEAAPPALLIAAEGDELVDPQRNTGQMSAMLRQHGVPVSEHYFDGVGHATLVASLAGPLRRLAPTLDEIEAFVQTASENRP